MKDKLNLQNSNIILILFLLYIALITLLSLGKANSQSSVKLFEHADKLVHFCFYFGYSFLLLWVVKSKNTKKNGLRNIVLVVVCTMLYSLLIEVLQPFFGRDCDIYDFIANSVGSICGAIAFNILQDRLLKR